MHMLKLSSFINASMLFQFPPVKRLYTVGIIIEANNSADLQGNNWLLAAKRDFLGCLNTETALESFGVCTLAGDQQCAEAPMTGGNNYERKQCSSQEANL